jgi:hypothetical protein
MPRNDIEAPVLHKARVAPSIASAPAFSPLTLQPRGLLTSDRWDISRTYESSTL